MGHAEPPPVAPVRPSAAAATLVELPRFDDRRGGLVALEFADALPFTPARAFAICDVPAGAVRADHANLTCDEALLFLAGHGTVVVRDGRGERQIHLDRPSVALVVPAGLWIVCRDLSADAVLLVLASAAYDPSDQVSDFEAYCAMVRADAT